VPVGLPSDLETTGRLLLAVVLGGLVGLERELTDHPAGVRTHITVALGSALFVIAGTYGFEEFFANRDDTNVSISVDRVASTVVTGIGFLCGGAILKQGITVKGLTTAGSLWVVSAIGMAVALGSYFAALAGTGIVLAVLVGLRLPERWIGSRRRNYESVVITLTPGADPSAVVSAIGELQGVRISTLRVSSAGGHCEIAADISGEPGKDLEPALAPLADREDVADIDVS
jgi:putative Mg2+ transporter-C (MgtC) family protein